MAPHCVSTTGAVPTTAHQSSRAFTKAFVRNGGCGLGAWHPISECDFGLNGLASSSQRGVGRFRWCLSRGGERTFEQRVR
jgi:hypothetical protein